MNTELPSVIERGGETCQHREALPQPNQQIALTDCSAVVPFERVKHLLSDKPLRRPNRTRPRGD